MDASEMKDVILAWASADEALEVVDEHEADGGFTIRIRTGGVDPPPVEVVSEPAVTEKLLVRTTIPFTDEDLAAFPGATRDECLASFTRAVHETQVSRAGLLSCRAEPEETGVRVVITHPCYSDGFDRHTFTGSVLEVDKARRQFQDVVTRAVAESTRVTHARPAIPVHAPAPPPVWTATHVTPPRGLRAWQTPNATLQPIADLAPGVQLRLLERSGDWTRVDASNGWRGWVDGRLLMAVAG